MERKNCPHCGARWLIEEFNFSIFQNMEGYRFEGSSVIIEKSSKQLKSNYTDRCLACGYHINREL